MMHQVLYNVHVTLFIGQLHNIYLVIPILSLLLFIHNPYIPFQSSTFIRVSCLGTSNKYMYMYIVHVVLVLHGRCSNMYFADVQTTLAHTCCLVPWYKCGVRVHVDSPTIYTAPYIHTQWRIF